MKRNENIEQLRLKKACGSKLIRISEMVLADDRREAMDEFGISYQTVSRYLKGEVLNLEKGVNLYEFLNSRIERRKEVLSA